MKSFKNFSSPRFGIDPKASKPDAELLADIEHWHSLSPEEQALQTQKADMLRSAFYKPREDRMRAPTTVKSGLPITVHRKKYTRNQDARR